MSDEYVVGDEDGLAPAQLMVRNAVARELYAQLPLRNQAIRQEDICGVAYAITMVLDRIGAIDDDWFGSEAAMPAEAVH